MSREDLANRIAENYETLRGWALRRTGNQDAAHDVAAETITRALARMELVERADDLDSYLFGIARRVLAELWRATAREVELVVEPVDRERGERGDDAKRAMQWEVIRAATKALPDPETGFEMARLHYVERLTIAQVARRFGKTANAVKSILYRLREAAKALGRGEEIRVPRRARRVPVRVSNRVVSARIPSGEFTAAEFAKLNGYSDRTAQRYLQQLVVSGRITKHGEVRGTTYRGA